MIIIRYANIQITEKLAKKIDEYILKFKESYHSMTELISGAIRLRIAKIKLLN